MKYFFYTFLLVASLGTAGAVINPALVQQGAALIGLKLPQHTTDPAEKVSDEDRLSEFMTQYRFAHQQNGPETVPTSTIPLAVVPAPPTVPPPSPPAIPAPVSEPVAPSYSSRWDGAATAPVIAPPAPDWSGPSQPFQEPALAPQLSVYETLRAPSQNMPDPFAPAQVVPSTEVFSAFPLPQQTPPQNGFEQTKYSQQATPPQPPLPQVPPMHGTLQTQAVLIEPVPVYGTETVARVGTQVILMGDILPKLRRTALKIVEEKIKQMPEAERAKTPSHEIEQLINTFLNAFIEDHYPEFLQEQILCTLVYCDYEIARSKAEKDMFNEKMGEEFDRNEVPEMMKEFNVDNIAALKKYLETKLGSSLERERRLWIKEQIVRQWISMSVQRATAECTHDEMREFYEKNMELFTTPAKARWQEMVVFFSSHSTEQEALHKIRWMGNQVAGGAPFEEIAKANSDGFTASKGGLWDWTSKGSLSSTELEQAVFSQPIKQLSPAILKSDTGFHIVRVLERQEVTVVSLPEAQGTIREKIRNQRAQRYQAEYFADLRRRFPMIIVKERIDFSVNSPRTAAAVR